MNSSSATWPSSGVAMVHTRAQSDNLRSLQDRRRTFSRPASTAAGLRLSSRRFLMISVARAATAVTSPAIGTTIATMSHAGVCEEEELCPADTGMPAPQDRHTCELIAPVGAQAILSQLSAC